MHYASNNRFERFWRIRFLDKPTERLAVPQLKEQSFHLDVKTAMFSLKIHPNPLFFSGRTADSIHLGRIIHAFELGLHHTTSVSNDTFSNLVLNINTINMNLDTKTTAQ